MRNAFDKEVFRSITHSFGRFLAIALMAALGTGFYAGLRMTAPDMKLAGDTFYDDTALMDVRVVNTLGLTDDDIDALRGIEGVRSVMPSREADAIATVDGSQTVVRVHSLDVEAARASDTSSGEAAVSDDEGYLNRPVLVEGSWPEAADECVLSADAVLDVDVSVGDTVRLVEGTQDLSDTFSQTEYTVSGFVRSSYYASSSNLGSTSLGSGVIETYMYVGDDSFSADLPYTEAFVSVVGARELAYPSDEYDAVVGAVVDRIEAAAPDMAASRVEQVRAEAQTELDDARAEYEEQRADAEAQLADGKAELDDARVQLDSAAAQLDDAQATISQSERDLADGQESYESGVAELAAQREQADAALSDAEAQLDAAQAQYDAAMAQRSELAGQLSQAQSGLEGVEEGIGQTQATVAALEGQIAALDPADPAYEQAKAQLEAQLSAAREALSGLQAQQAQLSAAVSQIQAGIAQIDEQIAGAPEGIAAGRAQLEERRAAAEQGFSEAQAQLDAAAAQLESGRVQLEQGKAEYSDGKREYADGLAAYEEGRAEYDEQAADAQEGFAEAEAELADAQAKVDDIVSEGADVYVLDRSKNIGAASFESDANRIDQIAGVFPLIFFLVAALVSLTTMTRMVDEDRVLIGTFKALGYGGARITSKYLVYALVASGAGAVVGIAFLSQFLPWFIMDAYSIVYAVPPRPTPIDPALAALSAGLGVGITVAATWLAAGSTLRERPASLMLPRAPKAGKRILLERIRPLWSRLSFSWKVTARNLFRYKRRFFMAVVGIAGCTALLLTGLGLQNAINDIIDKQFGDIYRYNTVVRMADDAPQEEMSAVEDALGRDTGEPVAWLHTENMLARSDAAAAQDGPARGDQRFELVVPKDAAGFGDFVSMRTRVGQHPITLSNDGVVVSEKLATELGVEAGDSIVLFDEDDIGNATGDGVRVTVAAVMENYVSQYVFMTPALYRQVMGAEPDYSTVYAKAPSDEGVRAALSDELLAYDGVKTVGYNDETIDTYRTMLQSVDSVVVILVIAAALLAFVVLYNLTNINIMERAREIATLKVLGFTPHEVNAYVYRETLLLTAIGALVGLALGVWMEGFVVVTAEVDQVMFGRDIHLASFAIAFALTMLFSVAVTLVMRRKLARIDMVESLKSVE